MKENKYILNTALAVVVGIALGVCIAVRTFAPAYFLPELDVPNMVLLSLIALLADHYLAKDAKRCYICIPIFSAITFGLLPWCASFVTGLQALKLGIIGGIVFTATTFLFTSIQDRISTGPAAKLAPIMSAVGLWLAAQCFMGWIL